MCLLVSTCLLVYFVSIQKAVFGEIYYSKEKCQFVIDSAWGEKQPDKAMYLSSYIEVIGNIYENGELLK